MNNDWTEISINTTSVAGELLSEFLLGEGAKGIVLGDWKPETISEYTTVKAYFPEDFENIDDLSKKVQNQLDIYNESGLNVGAREILVKVVKEESWANSWKQYFHVLHIGKNVVIKPLWEDYQAKENDIVVNVDPGMAFGTGAHPSTQLCMEKLEEIFTKPDANKNIKLLDLGTGSGILAILMRLLGLEDITAVDIDSVAVKSSKDNFAVNNMNINLFQGQLTDCKETYDFIAGNLLAQIIESVSADLPKYLNSKGLFMGAGIINHKENDVIKALTDNGLVLKEKEYQGDWVLLLFEKP